MLVSDLLDVVFKCGDRAYAPAVSLVDANKLDYDTPLACASADEVDGVLEAVEIFKDYFDYKVQFVTTDVMDLVIGVERG